MTYAADPRDNMSTQAGWAEWCNGMGGPVPHVAVHGRYGEIIGSAWDAETAAEVCELEGYTVIPTDNGGQIDYYDAEDGPGVQGYEPDGKGVFIVACESKPVAYKYNDPTEDARYIYDADEAREIEREDPSLIVWMD